MRLLTKPAVNPQIDDPSRKSATDPAPSADHIDHFDHFFNPKHARPVVDEERKGEREKWIIVLVGPAKR